MFESPLSSLQRQWTTNGPNGPIEGVDVFIRDVKFIAVFAEKSGTEAPMNITSDSAPEHFCIHLVQQGLSVLYILRFGQEMFEFC